MATTGLIWLAIGILFCIMEFVTPTALVQLAMGVSAILVALLAAIVPHLGAQVFLWMALSGISVYGLKRWFPKSRSLPLDETTEAEALTAMQPGEIGRVRFEGSSWRAQCEGDRAIQASDRAIVIGRKGNTLLVMLDDL